MSSRTHSCSDALCCVKLLLYFTIGVLFLSGCASTTVLHRPPASPLHNVLLLPTRDAGNTVVFSGGEKGFIWRKVPYGPSMIDQMIGRWLSANNIQVILPGDIDRSVQAQFDSFAKGIRAGHLDILRSSSIDSVLFVDLQRYHEGRGRLSGRTLSVAGFEMHLRDVRTGRAIFYTNPSGQGHWKTPERVCKRLVQQTLAKFPRQYFKSSVTFSDPRAELAVLLNRNTEKGSGRLKPSPENSVDASSRQSPPPGLQQRPQGDDLRFGRYHALVIGLDSYRDLPRLQTAANDAREVTRVIKQDYDFAVDLLLNPTRAEILSALAGYRRRLTKTDNLLIYYAGHGWIDEDAGQGYWLPVDATKDNKANWISNTDITAEVRAMRAKHVMVVADSCYAGKLVRGMHIKQDSPDYLSRMAQKKARVVLSSGGLEPVADSGGAVGHSVFASAFMATLRDDTGVLDGASLFSKIRRPVMVNSDQTPEYADIRKAGHDGGDFLFVHRAVLDRIESVEP